MNLHMTSEILFTLEVLATCSTLPDATTMVMGLVLPKPLCCDESPNGPEVPAYAQIDLCSRNSLSVLILMQVPPPKS